MAKHSPKIQNLLKQCEDKSGYACDVSYDHHIQGYSLVRMAGREGRLRHQIVIKEQNQLSEYYIAWQAVFILRQYQAEDADRPNITHSQSGLELMKEELAKLHPNLERGGGRRTGTQLALWYHHSTTLSTHGNLS